MGKTTRASGVTRWVLGMILVGLLLTPLRGEAAPGDNLRQINGAYSQPCSINTGLAFDGTNLLVTCWSHNVIDVLNPANGDLVHTVTVAGYGGLMAAAWDASRNKLWVCADHNKVILVDTADGSSTFAFSGANCTDGLAYDGTDDTLWISPDVSWTVYHYQTDGMLIAAHPVTGLIGSCGNSGIAVGGDRLYLANNGCSQIYEVSKDFTISTLFATFPRRLEDLECDDLTFAPLGAIWSQDAYDRVINAWEIPAGRCGFGGGGKPLQGRMTGGGVFTSDGLRVTHGFELHCDASQGPNNLQVNWDGNRFHLEGLTSAACSDDPNIDEAPPVAGFDTYKGTGTGRYNGVSGATAEWTFTDAGEPGSNDFAKIVIKDADSNVVLSVSGTLNRGNHQAHAE